MALISPEVLQRAFGEISQSKQLSSGLHVEIKTCPQCGNSKWKASVNLESGWFFCQVCRHKGIHIHQLVEPEAIRMFTQGGKSDTTPKKPMPQIPEGCVPVSDLGPESIISQYLKGRNVSLELAELKQILWKPCGPSLWSTGIFDTLQGLIHQIFRNEELVGWQFEATPRVEGVPKYITAPRSQIGSSFFNFDAAKNSQIGIVVEGVYDTYMFPDNGLGLLGSKISRRQLKLLSTCNFREIILLLDGDRTDYQRSKELMSLKSIVPNSRSVVLEEGDPSDHSREFFFDILGELC